MEHSPQKTSKKLMSSTTVALPLFCLKVYLSVGTWQEGKDADRVGSEQVD